MEKGNSKIEEIPIEEFENDKSDFRKEFAEKFNPKK